ncbi:DUF898 domain-containing protein [Mycolicibacillus trivialis]|uniref:DUF898 domain-containing protein n=1 Tax=Mycolicibacillus trivialis TaxID=1798 RepID=UPI001F17CAAA|nr:DUF898 domain-containing protein [Mycolicibacillus trivialis]
MTASPMPGPYSEPGEPSNYSAAPPAATPYIPERALQREFAFDGGAATYIGTAVLAFLITVCTLGICYPFALVLRERWRAKHSYIGGRQLVFNGSAWGLFGLWLKWLLLIIITLGIYGFWVSPRIARWKWENTGFA